MSTSVSRRVRARRGVATMAFIALTACGASDGAVGPSASDDSIDLAQPGEQAADDAAVEAQDAVDVARAGVDAGRLSQIDLGSGGVIVAGIDCISDGTGVLIIGARGMEPGVEIEMELDPSASTGQMFGQPDGTAYTGYQSRYDEFAYELSFPGIDGGVTTNIQGCG